MPELGGIQGGALYQPSTVASVSVKREHVERRAL